MRIENWSLSRKTMLLVAIPVALQTVLIFVAIGIWLHAEHLATKVARAKDVSLELQVFEKTMGDCVAACTVARSTFGQLGLEQARAQLKKLSRGYKRLHSLSTVNTKTSPDWQALDKAVESLIYGFKLSIGETEEGEVSAVVIRDKGLRDFRVFIDAIQRVSALESRGLDPAIAEADGVNAVLKMVLLALIGASALLAVGLVELYRRSIATRLLAVMETTELMSRRSPLAPALAGVDEIGTLDRQLHEIDAKLDEAMRNEKLVIANAADLVCALDASGTILSVNEKALGLMTGLKPEALVGKELSTIITEDQREQIQQELLATAHSDSTVKFKCDVLTADAKTIPTEWSVHWSNVNEALFCVAHNASQERALQSLRQEFLASMHKEIHEPLNRVYQCLAKLTTDEADPLPARSREELRRAQQSTTRLLMLVEDLLSVEQMASQELSLQLTKQSLSSIVEESVCSLDAFARTSEINVRTNVPADLFVNVDRARIIQVLVNILSNALKYSPAGSTVDIFCESTETQTTIYVCDEGPGIPEQYQEQVFAAYEQVPGRSSHRAASSGLGLNICKTIVEAHKGSIGVHSVPPHGSKFRFSLPVWSPEQKRSSEPDV